jgi:hypothetical protein
LDESAQASQQTINRKLLHLNEIKLNKAIHHHDRAHDNADDDL